jgi:hypothetical protein
MTTISSNNVLSLIVFIFFSKELFFFDEELLVVFSFFVIFNLLFFSIKGLVAFELTQRIALIYKQFIVYLDSKKNLLTLILLFYNNRTLILISKFLNTIDDFYFICQDNFQLYINSLIKWYQRSITSQLTLYLAFEHSYYKKGILLLICLNLTNMEHRIDFFTQNLAF